VPSRVLPTDKIRAEIDGLFGSGRDLAEIIEDVARLGARLLIQTAVEAEVEEFLGRARYQRRADVPDARAGSRNGFCPTTVPWRLIGQTLHARTSGDIVQIFRDQHVVATHVRRLSGRATNMEHYPPETIAFHLQGPTWCRKIATDVGPACELVIGDLLAPNAIHHLRAAQGILRLREKYGIDRLEAACSRAIEVGDPSYRTVKGILAVGTEAQDPFAGTGTGDISAVPAFLRGPDQFSSN